jgi:hypothetical protein
MKNELSKDNIDLNNVKLSWKKTLVQRRTFIQNNTTAQVLQEYPGYRHALLVSASLF